MKPIPELPANVPMRVRYSERRFLIAGLLNRNGLKTGHGNRWTRERVTSLRSHHRSPVFKTADDVVEPWLNLSDAARFLRIASKTLPLAAEAGKIEARHPFTDGPWIFARATLEGTPPKPSLNARIPRPDTPQDQTSPSKASFLQWHRQMGLLMRGCSRRPSS
jgi:hypothetical protein